MKNHCVVWLILSVLFLSCGDSEPGEVDKNIPSIEVFSPQRDIIFEQGDTVNIQALFSDDRSLRNGAVHIHDPYTQAVSDTVFSFYFKTDKTSFELDTFWIVNDVSDKSYVIYFESTDKAENYTRSLRYFHQFH